MIDKLDDTGPWVHAYGNRQMILKYYDPDLAFIPINKCGSNTITKALQRTHGFPVVLRRGEAVNLTCPIIAMWREPHQRMESLFRWYKMRGDILLSEDFNDFVQRWILEPKKFDPHICPQYIFCRAHGHIWLPTKIIRWDWPAIEDALELKNITHENASEPVEIRWRPDTRRLFDENYDIDIAVWNGCDNPYAGERKASWHVSAPHRITAAGLAAKSVAT